MSNIYHDERRRTRTMGWEAMAKRLGDKVKLEDTKPTAR